MAVLEIEKYRQKNGNDVLKVIIKPTKTFPEGAHFYCDASDEELVRKYSWRLMNQRQPYVVVNLRNSYTPQLLLFHREKKHNLLGYYPKCINHINGIEFDNVDKNLDVVTVQQNQYARPSKGYSITERSFVPYVKVNSQQIWAKRSRTEAEACISAYQLELQYEDYHYEFLKDRRNDLDILDMERTGKISEDEAVYRHMLRYADNAWYVYRYNLFKYFADNHLKVSKYSFDSEGYMTHHITGQRLCPL